MAGGHAGSQLRPPRFLASAAAESIESFVSGRQSRTLTRILPHRFRSGNHLDAFARLEWAPQGRPYRDGCTYRNPLYEDWFRRPRFLLRSRVIDQDALWNLDTLPPSSSMPSGSFGSAALITSPHGAGRRTPPPRPCRASSSMRIQIVRTTGAFSGAGP